MGIFRGLQPLVLPNLAPSVKTSRVASPWTPSQGLSPIVIGDVFGTENLPVDRAEAMRVPAVANARWLICTPLAKHPLKSYTGEAEDAAQPGWLYRTNGPVAPQMRMLWTLDDLLFGGYCLWGTARNAKGQITEAWRVPWESWEFDEDYRVLVNGAPMSAEQVILFVSPMDPLLECAARTIRAAGNIEQAWAARVKDPIPHTVIEQTEDIELDDTKDEDDKDEVDRIMEGYINARRSANASISFVPYGFKLTEFGTIEPQLYIEGRNAVALDIARFTALPAGLLNASQTQASLTYETKDGDRSTLADYSLAPWAMAIESRLSQDDCVPAGHSVRFATTQPETDTPRTED